MSARAMRARLVRRLWLALCLWAAALGWHCDRTVRPPSDLQRAAACSPWQQGGNRVLWDGDFDDQPNEVKGCLLVSQGETLRRVVARLNRSGELWAWDGQAFSADVPLSVPRSGFGDVSLQFWFYAPQKQKLNHEELVQFCDNLRQRSYRTCLPLGNRSCLFALSFRPEIDGVDPSRIEIPREVPGLADGEGPNCRLFYPESDTSSISFSTRTPAPCKCRDAKSFKAVTSLVKDVDGEVQSLALKPDGLVLLAVTGQTLLIFERSSLTSSFGAAKHKLSLSQKGWHIRFHNAGRLIAVVMDQRVEVHALSSLLAGELKPIFAKDAPGSALVADAVFRPTPTPLLAIAFYTGIVGDRVELWALSTGTQQEELLGHFVVLGPQALAFDREGRYLMAGYGVPPGNTAPGARFQIVSVNGSGNQAKLSSPRTFFTKLMSTYVTSLQVSPGNDYLIIGSGPSLSSLRRLSTSIPKGDHGQIEIKKTTPLSDDAGSLVLPGETYAHELYTQQIAFAPGGDLMASLGLVDPSGKQEVHLWAKTEKFPFYQFVTSLDVAAATRQVAFLPDCGVLLGASSSTTPINAWQGCR